MVTSLVLIPQFLLILLFLPESPSWLISKGRDAEARKSTNYIKRFNGEPIEKAELPVPSPTAAPQKNVYTIVDLLSNRFMIRRTFILCFIWFTASLSSYTIDLNSRNLSGHFYWNQLAFSLMIGCSKTVSTNIFQAMISCRHCSLDSSLRHTI